MARKLKVASSNTVDVKEAPVFFCPTPSRILEQNHEFVLIEWYREVILLDKGFLSGRVFRNVWAGDTFPSGTVLIKVRYVTPAQFEDSKDSWAKNCRGDFVRGFGDLLVYRFTVVMDEGTEERKNLGRKLETVPISRAPADIKALWSKYVL